MSAVSPAIARYLTLRERGYLGWIDQDGYACTELQRGVESRRLTEAEIEAAITHGEGRFEDVPDQHLPSVPPTADGRTER